MNFAILLTWSIAQKNLANLRLQRSKSALPVCRVTSRSNAQHLHTSGDIDSGLIPPLGYKRQVGLCVVAIIIWKDVRIIWLLYIANGSDKLRKTFPGRGARCLRFDLNRAWNELSWVVHWSLMPLIYIDAFNLELKSTAWRGNVLFIFKLHPSSLQGLIDCHLFGLGTSFGLSLHWLRMWPSRLRAPSKLYSR